MKAKKLLTLLFILNFISVFSIDYSGNFTVGGSSGTYYPVLFSVAGTTAPSSLGKLSIYRPNVHENGTWAGTFHSEIEFIACNYGHIDTKFVSFTYITGNGNAYSDPIGDISDGTGQAGNSQIVIWLKGGASYKWSASNNSVVTLLDDNSTGTSKTSASGQILPIKIFQSDFVVNAKNNRYLKSVGVATDKLNVYGDLNVAGSISNLRMTGGNYGSILRNDGGATFMLLTNAGDPNGSFNSLRPFKIENSTGNVFLANDKFQVMHNTGFVGIGTTPTNFLDVAATNGNGIRIGKINDIGNAAVAIGAKAAQLNIDFTGYRDMALDQIGARIAAYRLNRHVENSALVQKTGLSFYTNPSGLNTGTTDLVERMCITPEGKVGIGLSDMETKLNAPSDELLTVNGVIHAKEVRVDLTGALADYVFDKNYDLMPLNKVEEYVNANSHLPEMPSAAEVKEKGMSMGEMQNKMLQKIEELTLYVIQQQKTIDSQNRKIDELSKQLKK